MRDVRLSWVVVAWALALAALLGSVASAASVQDEPSSGTALSINGYEGVLEKMEIGAAVQSIKELGIGDPPFLKEMQAPETSGLVSTQGGVLQKGDAQVNVYKLQFQSEDQAGSVVNLERKRTTGKKSPLMVEDPTNIRTPDFGLFYDEKTWSGYRRVKEFLVLMKGAVDQEDFYRIMEKAI